MACCPPGAAPYLPADHDDEGRIFWVDGVQYYQVGSGEVGLLIGPDVWGWNSGRTRAIADELAKLGLTVYVPKVLPAFEGGTDDDGLPPAFNIKERFGEIVPLLKGEWGAGNVTVKMLKVVGAMRLAGVTRIGFLGFCYGGWLGFHLAKEVDLVCGATPHPSVHLEGMVGGDPAALAAQSKCPWALFPCGEVGQDGSDPDIYDASGALYKALEKIHPGKNSTKRFRAMPHGFVCRGAIKPGHFMIGSGEETKKAVQECLEDITNFFVARGLLPATVLPAILYYFPAGGRGELSRLVAAAGGVRLIEGSGAVDKSEFGSPSGVPLLVHGEVKMAQSTAIENYLSLWAFPDLQPAMRAVDMQFCSIKEDILGGYYKVYFNPELKAKAAEELPKVTNKWYPVIEKRCPANGFFNGQDYPTAADLAVLNICDCVHVFAGAHKNCGIDVATTYPKMRALANRTAEFPAVKEYLANSKTFLANPMGL